MNKIDVNNILHSVMNSNDVIEDNSTVIDMHRISKGHHRTHYLKWPIRSDLSLRMHIQFQDRRDLENVYILKNHATKEFNKISKTMAENMINSNICDDYIEIMGMLENKQYVKFTRIKGQDWIERNDKDIDYQDSMRLPSELWSKLAPNIYSRKMGNWIFKVEMSYDELNEEKMWFLYIDKIDRTEESIHYSYEEVLDTIRNASNTKNKNIHLPLEETFKEEEKEENANN